MTTDWGCNVKANLSKPMVSLKVILHRSVIGDSKVVTMTAKSFS